MKLSGLASIAVAWPLLAGTAYAGQSNDSTLQRLKEMRAVVNSARRGDSLYEVKSHCARKIDPVASQILRQDFKVYVNPKCEEVAEGAYYMKKYEALVGKYRY